jgi:replicative DNA helicase
MTNQEPTQIPHSREAEEAVLGSILINPDAYYDVAYFLRADDFYIHRNGWIWEAFSAMQPRHIPIDLLTLTEELDRKGQLAEIGGPAFLTALVNQVPTSINAESYGRIVASHAARRRLIQAANQIAALAYDEQREIDAVMSEAIHSLESAAVRSTGDTLLPLSASIAETYDRVDQSSRTTELPGVSTGIPELDQMLGNLQAGNVYVMAARPGQGKTSLQTSIMLNAAHNKKRAAFFSLEMSRSKIIDRLLAQETGLNVQLLNTGKLNESQWPIFTSGLERIGELPIFLDDTSSITPAQVLTRCRREVMNGGPFDLIAIDYLQLMGADGRAENRTQEIGLISRSLKMLSKELDVPVLVAAQLNRDVEKRGDKVPQLSDLRESGNIEADADVVIFLHQSEPELTFDVQPVNLIIAKQRNGPVGQIEVKFHKSNTHFVSGNSKNKIGASNAK